MKKLTLFFFLFIISLCLPSYAQDKSKITFLWWPDPGGGFEDAIRGFEKENPDIDVDMIKGPTSTDAREVMYSASFMAREATYDLVLMDVTWLPKFAKQGWLLPLGKWFDEDKQRDFLPGDIRGSIFEGEIYRVPLQTDAGVMYYRRDLLEGKGYNPPQTWGELVRIAKGLQDPPNVWGFVFQGKQYEGLVCNFLEVLWSFGGDLFDEEGNLALNSKEGVEALTFMHDLVHTYKIAPEGVTTYEEEESRHAFQEGRAVFCRNWPYLWPLAQVEGSPVKGRIGIIPMPHKEGYSSAACLGGWGFGISSFSRHKEECIRFITYITGYAPQKKLHMKSGIVPTRRALFEDEDLLGASPHYADLYKVLMAARPRPMRTDYAQVSDILRRFIHKAMLGEASAADALDGAEREIRKVLGMRL